MSDVNTLIEALIHSNESLVETTKQTNQNVKDLTNSVNELIVDRAVRVEQDVAQQKVNSKLDKFIDDNAQNLYRLDNWYKMQNKVIIGVVTVAVLAIGKLIGVDWKG